MQILQEQKSALPPTPVNRATEPPSSSCLSYFMLVPNPHHALFLAQRHRAQRVPLFHSLSSLGKLHKLLDPTFASSREKNLRVFV